MDDIIFTQTGLYIASCIHVNGKTVTIIPTKFCSSIKISKYTTSVAHWGRSLLSMIAVLLLSLYMLVVGHNLSRGDAVERDSVGY